MMTRDEYRGTLEKSRDEVKMRLAANNRKAPYSLADENYGRELRGIIVGMGEALALLAIANAEDERAEDDEG